MNIFYLYIIGYDYKNKLLHVLLVLDASFLK